MPYTKYINPLAADDEMDVLEEPEDGAFVGGIKSGFYGLGSSLKNTLAAGGRIVGADEFAQAREQEADASSAQAQAAGRMIPRLKDVDSLGGAYDWAAGMVGQNLPLFGAMAASSVLGGAAGSALMRKNALAKSLGKVAREDALAASARQAFNRDIAERIAAAEEARAVLKVNSQSKLANVLSESIGGRSSGAKIGSYIGTAAPYLSTTVGDTYGSIRQDPDAQGTPEEQAVASLQSGAAQTGLGMLFIPTLGVVPRMMRGTRAANALVGQSAGAKGAAKVIGASMLGEGLTEAGEQAIQQHTQNQFNPNLGYDGSQILEAGLGGALVGGVFSSPEAAHAALRKPRAPFNPVEQLGAINAALSDNTQQLDAAQKTAMLIGKVDLLTNSSEVLQPTDENLREAYQQITEHVDGLAQAIQEAPDLDTKHDILATAMPLVQAQARLVENSPSLLEESRQLEAQRETGEVEAEDELPVVPLSATTEQLEASLDAHNDMLRAVQDLGGTTDGAALQSKIAEIETELQIRAQKQQEVLAQSPGVQKVVEAADSLARANTEDDAFVPREQELGDHLDLTPLAGEPTPVASLYNRPVPVRLSGTPVRLPDGVEGTIFKEMDGPTLKRTVMYKEQVHGDDRYLIRNVEQHTPLKKGEAPLPAQMIVRLPQNLAELDSNDEAIRINQKPVRGRNLINLFDAAVRDNKPVSSRRIFAAAERDYKEAYTQFQPRPVAEQYHISSLLTNAAQGYHKELVPNPVNPEYKAPDVHIWDKNTNHELVIPSTLDGLLTGNIKYRGVRLSGDSRIKQMLQSAAEAKARAEPMTVDDVTAAVANGAKISEPDFEVLTQLAQRNAVSKDVFQEVIDNDLPLNEEFLLEANDQHYAVPEKELFTAAQHAYEFRRDDRPRGTLTVETVNGVPEYHLEADTEMNLRQNPIIKQYDLRPFKVKGDDFGAGFKYIVNKQHHAGRVLVGTMDNQLFFGTKESRDQLIRDMDIEEDLGGDVNLLERIGVLIKKESGDERQVDVSHIAKRHGKDVPGPLHDGVMGIVSGQQLNQGVAVRELYRDGKKYYQYDKGIWRSPLIRTLSNGKKIQESESLNADMQYGKARAEEQPGEQDIVRLLPMFPVEKQGGGTANYQQLAFGLADPSPTYQNDRLSNIESMPIEGLLEGDQAARHAAGQPLAAIIDQDRALSFMTRVKADTSRAYVMSSDELMDESFNSPVPDAQKAEYAKRSGHAYRAGHDDVLLLPGTYEEINKAWRAQHGGKDLSPGDLLLLHRDPALPDATSMSVYMYQGVAELENPEGSHNRGIVIHEGSDGWKAAAGDFDGDSGVLMVPKENLWPRARRQQAVMGGQINYLKYGDAKKTPLDDLANDLVQKMQHLGASVTDAPSYLDRQFTWKTKDGGTQTRDLLTAIAAHRASGFSQMIGQVMAPAQRLAEVGALDETITVDEMDEFGQPTGREIDTSLGILISKIGQASISAKKKAAWATQALEAFEHVKNEVIKQTPYMLNPRTGTVKHFTRSNESLLTKIARMPTEQLTTEEQQKLWEVFFGPTGVVRRVERDPEFIAPAGPIKAADIAEFLLQYADVPYEKGAPFRQLSKDEKKKLNALHGISGIRESYFSGDFSKVSKGLVDGSAMATALRVRDEAYDKSLPPDTPLRMMRTFTVSEDVDKGWYGIPRTKGELWTTAVLHADRVIAAHRGALMRKILSTPLRGLDLSALVAARKELIEQGIEAPTTYRTLAEFLLNAPDIEVSAKVLEALDAIPELDVRTPQDKLHIELAYRTKSLDRLYKEIGVFNSRKFLPEYIEAAQLIAEEQGTTEKQREALAEWKRRDAELGQRIGALDAIDDQDALDALRSERAQLSSDIALNYAIHNITGAQLVAFGPQGAAGRIVNTNELAEIAKRTEALPTQRLQVRATTPTGAEIAAKDIPNGVYKWVAKKGKDKGRFMLEEAYAPEDGAMVPPKGSVLLSQEVFANAIGGEKDVFSPMQRVLNIAAKTDGLVTIQVTSTAAKGGSAQVLVGVVAETEKAVKEATGIPTQKYAVAPRLTAENAVDVDALWNVATMGKKAAPAEIAANLSKQLPLNVQINSVAPRSTTYDANDTVPAVVRQYLEQGGTGSLYIRMAAARGKTQYFMVTGMEQSGTGFTMQAYYLGESNPAIANRTAKLLQEKLGADNAKTTAPTEVQANKPAALTKVPEILSWITAAEHAAQVPLIFDRVINGETDQSRKTLWEELKLGLLAMEEVNPIVSAPTLKLLAEKAAVTKFLRDNPNATDEQVKAGTGVRGVSNEYFATQLEENLRYMREAGLLSDTHSDTKDIKQWPTAPADIEVWLERYKVSSRQTRKALEKAVKEQKTPINKLLVLFEAEDTLHDRIGDLYESTFHEQAYDQSVQVKAIQNAAYDVKKHVGEIISVVADKYGLDEEAMLGLYEAGKKYNDAIYASTHRHTYRNQGQINELERINKEVMHRDYTNVSIEQLEQLIASKEGKYDAISGETDPGTRNRGEATFLGVLGDEIHFLKAINYIKKFTKEDVKIDYVFGSYSKALSEVDDGVARSNVEAATQEEMQQTAEELKKQQDEYADKIKQAAVKSGTVNWDTLRALGNADITLYRGADFPTEFGDRLWTSDKKKAEKAGAVTEITLPASVIYGNATSDTVGNDEFLFLDKQPAALAAVQAQKVEAEKSRARNPNREALLALDDKADRTRLQSAATDLGRLMNMRGDMNVISANDMYELLIASDKAANKSVAASLLTHALYRAQGQEGGSNGVHYIRADGSHAIYVSSALTEEQKIGVLAHELGHGIIDEAWSGLENSNKPLRESILADYAAYQKEQGKKASTGAKPHMDGAAGAESNGFHEWLANRIRDWLTTKEAPRNAAGSWYAELAKKFVEAFQRVVSYMRNFERPQMLESVDTWLTAMAKKSDEIERVYGRGPEGMSISDRILQRRARLQAWASNATASNLEELNEVVPDIRDNLDKLLSPDDVAMLRRVAHTPAMRHRLTYLVGSNTVAADAIAKSTDAAVAYMYALTSMRVMTVPPAVKNGFATLREAAIHKTKMLREASDEDVAEIIRRLNARGATIKPTENLIPEGSPAARLYAERSKQYQKGVMGLIEHSTQAYKAVFGWYLDEPYLRIQRTGIPALMDAWHLVQPSAYEIGGMQRAGESERARVNYQIFDQRGTVILKDLGEAERTQLVKYLHTDPEANMKVSAKVKEAADKMRQLMEDAWKYEHPRVTVAHRENYWPMVPNHEYITDNLSGVLDTYTNPAFLDGWFNVKEDYKKWAAKHLSAEAAADTADKLDEMWAQSPRKFVEFYITKDGQRMLPGQEILQLPADQLHTPSFRYSNPRELNFLLGQAVADPALHEQVLSTLNLDPKETIDKYFRNATKRMEHAWFLRNLGPGGMQGLAERAKAQGATNDDIRIFSDSIMAVQGLLGLRERDWLDKFIDARKEDSWLKQFHSEKTRVMNPEIQKASSMVMAWENISHLALSLAAAAVDPAGQLARHGSWDTFTGSISETRQMFKALAKDMPLSARAALLQRLGTLEHSMRVQDLNSTYMADQMHKGTARVMDTFFRFNGVEKLTDWARAMASFAALSSINHWYAQATSTDGSVSAEQKVRALKELHSLGLAPEDVIMENGDIKVLSYEEWAAAMDNPAEQERDLRVRVAVHRFVDQSTVRPEATNRALWMSNPYYGIPAQWKAFSTAFGTQILKPAWAKMVEEGNATPMMWLALTGIPIMLFADLLRDAVKMSFSDDEDEEGDKKWRPQWKQSWTLGDHISYAVRRAGLYGGDELAGHVVEPILKGRPAEALAELGGVAVSDARKVARFGADAFPLPLGDLTGNWGGPEKKTPKTLDRAGV